MRRDQKIRLKMIAAAACCAFSAAPQAAAATFQGKEIEAGDTV